MIRSDKAHLPFTADSHPGMSGKNNEDSYGVFAYQIAAKRPIPVLVGIVSDGIGGHRAGEVASQIAVNVIKEHLDASDGSHILNDINAAIIDASNRIHAQSQSNSEQKGMGATVACACVVGNRLFTTTVGDSPIFLIRGSQIQQLSIDHTWIQEALDAGILKPDQVEGHPNAHVIRRYLGGAKPPEADFRMRLTGRETDEQARANQGTPLFAGDRILLCSDGLTDLVKPQEILQIVKEKPKDAAVAALIDLANQRGGHDNITVILIEITEAVRAAAGVAPAAIPAWQYLTVGCLGALILAVIGGFFLLTYIRNRPLQKTTPSPTITISQTAPALTLTPTPSIVATPTIDGTAAWQTQQPIQETEDAVKKATQQAVEQTRQAELSNQQTAQAKTKNAQASQSPTPTGTLPTFTPTGSETTTPGGSETTQAPPTPSVTGTPPTATHTPSSTASSTGTSVTGTPGGALKTSTPTLKTPAVTVTLAPTTPVEEPTEITLAPPTSSLSPTPALTSTWTPWFKTWTPRPTRTRYPTWTPRPTWQPIFP